MLKSNYVRMRIRIYSPLYLANVLKNNNIPFSNLKNEDEYIYTFEISPKYLKKTKRILKEVEVAKRFGVITWFYSLLLKKTTIIALIISVFAFFDMTSRVYDIFVNGTNRKINEQMKLKLLDLGVYKGMRKPSFQKITEYEEGLKLFFKDEVEFLELRLKGVDFFIKYTPQREDVVLPNKGSSIYAKKDGVIAYFAISSGEIMVKENQYVQEGTLLVSDTLIGSDNKEYKIGAYGKVYAYTWTIIDLSSQISSLNTEVDQYLELMQKAKYMMCAGFEEEEKILEENILLYEIKDNIMRLKIHFTCLENIAISN